MIISRRQLLALGASAVVVAACSDSTSSGSTSAATTSAAPPPTAAPTTVAATTTTAAATTTSTTAAPTTTEAATTTTLDLAKAAAAYTEPGPHPVGVTTLQLAKGPKVEVWYPAVTGTTGTVTYDVRDFTPPAIKALLTADVPATYSIAGGRNADVAEGSFPVVLFSHGFTGIRLQSSFLTSHLASWGFVVAAPDHPSRDLPDVLGGTAKGGVEDSVDDLLQTLALVTAQGDDATSRLHGHVDASKVVAVGHSAGGGTVVGAATDDRVLGFVSLASGLFLGRGSSTASTLPGATTTTVAPAPPPSKPSLFVAGKVDAVVPVDSVTRPSFEQAATPTRLWVIDGVGHNGFDDFCTFGNGKGIIGVAEAAGLGAYLDSQGAALKRLGQDGCIPPAVPVATTFPTILHVVTAWIRDLFAIDAEPVGLGPEVAGRYATPVEILERL